MAKSDRTVGSLIVAVMVTAAITACGAPAPSAASQSPLPSASAVDSSPASAVSQAPALSTKSSAGPSPDSSVGLETSDNPSIPAASARKVCLNLPETSVAAAIGLPVAYNPGLSGAVKGVYPSEDGVICTFTTPDLVNEASVNIYFTPFPANTLIADRRRSIGDRLPGIGNEAMVSAGGIYFRSGNTWYQLELDSAVGHSVGTTGKNVEFGTESQYRAFAQAVIAAHPLN